MLDEHAPYTSSTPLEHRLSSLPPHDRPEFEIAEDDATYVRDILELKPLLVEEKHPKGRRKRTAAKDKLILEQAYASDPKPDKKARLHIVNRVSLNEKEVQIWFQNRRQNDRRKSRPLLPEEVAALRSMGVDNNETCMDASPVDAAELIQSYRVEGNAAQGAGLVDGPTTLAPSQSDGNQPQSSAENLERQEGEDAVEASAAEGPVSNPDATSSIQSTGGSLPSFKCLSSSTGFLANRWNPSRTRPRRLSLDQFKSCSARFPLSTDHTAPIGSAFGTCKSNVIIRISQTMDGRAELVPELSPVRIAVPPRPSSTLPRLPCVQRGGFKRSHSALPSVTLPPISALTGTLPQLTRGRSRDVHAWESCAEPEAPDELTAQAEDESKGSATAAISILRGLTPVLHPTASKRNLSCPQNSTAAQLKKPRPRQARWIPPQRKVLEPEPLAQAKRPCTSSTCKIKGSTGTPSIPSPSDSDKENWILDKNPHPAQGVTERLNQPIPAADRTPCHHRTFGLPRPQRHPNLLRANTMPFSSSTNEKAQPLKIYEDSSTQALGSRSEVVSFMRSDISPNKRDIANSLLSLSKGNWR